MRRRPSVAVGICLFGLLLHAAFASAQITDEALLFSAKGAQRAATFIYDIRKGTNPQKEVIVRTLPSLPSNDSDPKAIAQRLFREQRPNGMLILIVKQPPTVLFAAGNDILPRFRDAEGIRKAMLADVAAERFDEALIRGLPQIRSELEELFPKKTVSSLLPAERPKVVGDAPRMATKKLLGLGIGSYFFFVLYTVLAAVLLRRFIVFDYFFDLLATGFSRLKRRIKSTRAYTNLAATAQKKAGRRRK